MAKKYVPSGYQIIDLGSHDLSSAVTITSFDDDLKVLNELCVNALTNFPNQAIKPLLIKIRNTNLSELYILSPEIKIDFENDYVYLYCLVNATVVLQIAITYESIVIETVNLN